jgi:hypothetical protein
LTVYKLPNKSLGEDAMNQIPAAYYMTCLDGSKTSNRVGLFTVPSVGDEITVVHGMGDSNTLCRVTKIRHMAIRCWENQIPGSSEQRIVLWVEEIPLGAGEHDALIPFL